MNKFSFVQVLTYCDFLCNFPSENMVVVGNKFDKKK